MPSSPAPTDPLDTVTSVTGLDLPADLATLLGDRAVVAYGGLRVDGLPDVAVRTHPGDLAAAQAVAETLRSHLSDASIADLGVQTTGGDLVVATSADYAGRVAAAGDLGDQPQVRTALGDLPDEVSVAGYADLDRIWPVFGSGVPADVRHLKAVGFWATSTGDIQHLQLRLVVG